jgi:enoyl-[acyl-carrier protein] reductase/trans-2-enoyl-CoA reductase (NAD+)
MPGIILENPLGKFPLILGAHAGGATVLAEQQIQRALAAFPEPLNGAVGRTALVIGNTSFGYGSAASMALRAAGFGRIIGIGYEVPPVFGEDKATGEPTVRRATPGWYLTNTLHERGVVRTTYLADAFADATRARVFQDLAASNQGIDLLLYSLAAPSRTYNGQKWTSALKVIGDPISLYALDFSSGQLKAKTVDAATEEEIENTRRVMGGEDLALWVGGLLAAGLLQEGATVAALSYVGPPQFESLRRLYWDGTIGAAKKDIDKTTRELNETLAREVKGRAFSVVDPAVVTVASSAIPAIGKYLASYLGVVDGGVGIYHDPLSVGINFARALYGGASLQDLLDEEGRLRLDGDELEPRLQDAIMRVWEENDREGEPTPALRRGLEIFREKFRQLYGFSVPGVDYARPHEFDVALTPDKGVFDLISGPPPAALQAVPVAAPDAPTKRMRGDETRKISAVENFFNALLSRDNEPGVARIQEDGKAVFVSEHTFDPERVRAYAEVTNQPQDGSVPSAFTFVIAFSNILDAIKDILKDAPKKSVIHAAEEIALPNGPIPASGTVKVRAWLSAEKGKRGEGPVMAFVNREIVGADGTLLATGRTTLLIGQDLSQLPAAAAKPADLEGELLGTIMMTQDWINRYSRASGDANPIHMSEAAARDLGLSSTIAHGVLTLGLSNRDHAASYKAAWKTPVTPGDVVEFRRSGKKIVGVKTAPDGQKLLVIELTPR